MIGPETQKMFTTMSPSVCNVNTTLTILTRAFRASQKLNTQQQLVFLNMTTVWTYSQAMANYIDYMHEKNEALKSFVTNNKNKYS